jgi:prolyl oligopeptidase
MKPILAALLAVSSITAIAQTRPSAFTGKYPVTNKGTQTDVFFSKTVADPYRWLEDDRSAETADWVARQNAVTNAYLSKIPFREMIRRRLTELWNYEKFSAPFKEGDWTYFYKNDGLQNQSVLYRQKENGTPEVFLDPNKFSADATTSLAGIEFTKDGSLCAFQISEGGSDWRKVIVMDTRTKKQIGDTLMDVKFSGLSWFQNEGFFYSSYDKPKEGSQLAGMTDQHKLYWHKLGTPQSADKLVFGGSQTPRRYVGGYMTEDQRHLVVTASQATYGNELYIANVQKGIGDEPKLDIVPVVTGFENEQEVVYAEDGTLYILTNAGAPNRKLVTASANAPQPANWKELIPQTDFPLSVSTGGRKLFAQYLKDAVSEVQQYSLDGKRERTITLPGLGSAGGFSGKRDEKELYYSFTNYIYPPTIFRYTIGEGKSDVYKKPAVKFDPEKFESRQVFYVSKDGARVPMIVSHRKGVQLNGSNPTMLYGYGGFNVSLTPSFGVSAVAFMEAGGVYAVANLRGGGEYGDAWHNAGTKLQKQNVFDDFIAAAEYLIENKYTTRERLAISGGSNGGLLVGATMLQRPDLFRVAFPAVGVLDMLRYHKFTAGAGWAYDYGTADDNEEMFNYLYKYSPVHNTKKGTCYPATMVTTADHDDRVVPAHSFKFAAALQEAQGCDNPALIRIDVKAGHGAGKPTSMIIAEATDKWSFLFWNMGVTPAFTTTPPGANQPAKREMRSTDAPNR